MNEGTTLKKIRTPLRGIVGKSKNQIVTLRSSYYLVDFVKQNVLVEPKTLREIHKNITTEYGTGVAKEFVSLVEGLPSMRLSALVEALTLFEENDFVWDQMALAPKITTDSIITDAYSIVFDIKNDFLKGKMGKAEYNVWFRKNNV